MGSFTKWRGLSPEYNLTRYSDNFFDRSFRRGWENDLAVDKDEITAPAVNIRKEQSAYTLEFAAPGFQKSDFQIEVKDRVLSISAEKEDKSSTEKEKAEGSSGYTRREFMYHTFDRRFTLPDNAKEKDITAHYENGILSVVVPVESMEETEKPRRVLIG